ncbi:YibE/F family protein [Streptomyces phaeoluteigriseus]|uniref:YibE/F family protein n=1 Tax=Streptomyces phaeoluteigriseus TaxID=114686 RepID=A0ABY4ZLZ0_9ACTN|nr:YibE/F family protein [Streptomyces phaeoluteigriseus]USQ89322.1 YibE/F family protein [Streptomyces phaeoluteigriseus]
MTTTPHPPFPPPEQPRRPGIPPDGRPGRGQGYGLGGGSAPRPAAQPGSSPVSRPEGGYGFGPDGGQGAGSGGPGHVPGDGGHGFGGGQGGGRDGGAGEGAGGGRGHGPGPGPGPGDGHGSDDGSGNGNGHSGGHGGHGPGAGDGHGHSHSHGPAAPVSRHLRKVIAAVLIPFGVAVLVGMVVLWPGGAPAHERTGVGFDRQTQQATVAEVESISCSSANASGGTPTGDTSTAEGSSAQQQEDGTCKRATIRVDTGSDKGRTFTEIVQPDQSRQLHEGQKVVVAYEPSAPKDLQYSVTDVDRRVPLSLLAIIFAVAVVVVGRLRGVMALVALAISFAVLNFFVLPAILQGSNPLAVAVVGASAIMLIALYLCHGLSARTSVAVLGTLISLLLIGVLGSWFVDWAALTGNTDDNTGLIHGLYPTIDMSGLLLAGIIIGSLGVLDDVTVTQTSAVWELHEANPSMGWRGLYRAGIRIGRDHIASVVNTLVLAYAGAALPLLLLFSIAESSVGTVANSELVAQEIVRTLIGSIGLVASVPVTTALAALVVSADRPETGALPETASVTPGATSAGTSGPAPQQGSRGGKGRRRKH